MSIAPRIDRHDKNFLLNSGFHFRQRIGSGATTVTAGNGYYLDRWGCRMDASGSITSPTIQRVQDSPNTKTKFCMGVAGTPTGSTSQVNFYQRLEASEARQIVGEILSFGIWVKTDSWTTVSLRLLTAIAEDDFSSYTGGLAPSQTFTASGGWQLLVFENQDLSAFAGSLINGLEVRLEFTGATNTGASRFLRIGQVMLNIGPTASAWQMQSQSIGEELSKCQRYYEKSYDLDTAPATPSISGGLMGSPIITLTGGPNSYCTEIGYKVQKRTGATPLFYHFNGTLGQWSTALASTVSTARAVVAEAQNQWGFYPKFSGVALSEILAQGHWIVDAEL